MCSLQTVGVPFDVHAFLSLARPMATRFSLLVYDESDSGTLCTFALGADGETYYYTRESDGAAAFSIVRDETLDAAYNLFTPSDSLLDAGSLGGAVDLMVHLTESALGVAFDLSYLSLAVKGK